MRVIIEKDYEAMSNKAAGFIADLVRKKPHCVLGLATGSTPVGLYERLIHLHLNEGLDFSKVTTFNLDEYYGLAPNHDQSYHYFMHDKLFNHINIPAHQINVPSGLARDVDTWCSNYEQHIRDADGIDIQVLGIGGDGHIAFNEPGSSLGSRTRIKTLTEETISDNARFFDNADDVPQFAITMGVGTIMETKQCLLMANGDTKSKVLAEAIEGPITAQVTASALQWHASLVVMCDEAAAGNLTRHDYYNHIERMSSKMDTLR